MTRTTKWLLRGGLACLVGIPVFIGLHGLFDWLGTMAGEGTFLATVANVLSVFSFLAALFLCPAGAAILLAAAGVVQLTDGRPAWLRSILLVLVPAGAVWLAVAFMTQNRVSVIEKDPAAGFNGGFEAVRAGLPVNWYLYRVPLDDGDAVAAIDSVDAVEGRQSLRFTVQSPADPSSRRREPGIFQTQDAEAGATYDVSFWLKSEGSQLRLLITSEKPDSRARDSEIRDVIAPGAAWTGEWQRFVYTYTVPSDYSNLRFEAHVMLPGRMWIDGVRIERVEGEE